MKNYVVFLVDGNVLKIQGTAIGYVDGEFYINANGESVARFNGLHVTGIVEETSIQT